MAMKNDNNDNNSNNRDRDRNHDHDTVVHDNHSSLGSRW